MTAYRQLETRFRQIGTIEQAISVLHWDTAAMMPSGGAMARAEQLATLRLIAHQHLTEPEIKSLLVEAEAAGDPLDNWQRANLREMRRRWRHAAAVPGALVEAESRACSECEAVWRKARAENNFAAVLPGLQQVLHLERELAAIKAERFGTSPYEALLDQYEPGGSVATIDHLFDEIASFLPDLLEGVLTRQAALPSPPAPSGPFPVEAQRCVAMKLMERIGFDFTHGRLDVSAHPFCGGTPDDVRITTRYNESDFAKSRCRCAAAEPSSPWQRQSCARPSAAMGRAGKRMRYISARSGSGAA
jgi:carboxypeptidase Taq